MKKIILFVISIFILATSSIPAFASTTETIKSVEDKDAKLVKAYKVQKDGLKELDINNIKINTDQNISKNNSKSKLFSISDIPQNIIIPPHYKITYTYNESGRVRNCGLSYKRQRCSQYVYNYTTSNLTRTVKTSCKNTYSCNISFNGGQKDVLAATIGGSYAFESLYEDSIAVTVKPGEYSWVEFSPLFLNSYGWMVTRQENAVGQVSWNNEWTDLYLPQEITGIDGSTITDGNIYVYSQIY